MSQPPYPSPGGSEPEWSRGWSPPPDDADEPTQQLRAPGGPQRQQTQPFGQPPFGQPQFGPPQFGPPPYGPPPYGQQPYGPPPYGQPQYGGPGAPWGPPGGPGGQPPKGGRNTLIALIIAGVVVVAAIGVALFLVLGKNGTTIATGATATAMSGPTAASSSGPSSSSSSSSADGASSIPPAGALPEGLGDDPVLDRYAQSCYDGDMNACDTLYNDSEVGSDYETYGGTCAGRQPISNSDVVYCTDAFPS
jgi:hypothetical protein